MEAVAPQTWKQARRKQSSLAQGLGEPVFVVASAASLSGDMRAYSAAQTAPFAQVRARRKCDDPAEETACSTYPERTVVSSAAFRMVFVYNVDGPYASETLPSARTTNFLCRREGIWFLLRLKGSQRMRRVARAATPELVPLAARPHVEVKDYMRGVRGLTATDSCTAAAALRKP